jgi:hypothetical protein
MLVKWRSSLFVVDAMVLSMCKILFAPSLFTMLVILG